MKATFIEQDHSYWMDGKKLISVTQLMQKHGLSLDYSFIDPFVLDAKAKRGTFIHKEIEDYINTDAIGFTSELDFFMKKEQELGLENMVAEQIVNNDLVAGTIDLQSVSLKTDETILADFKTATKIDKEAVRWQLSLYERLSGKKFDKLMVFHLVENAKVIELERIPTEEIDKLLECEANGTLYQKKELAISSQLLVDIQTAEQLIKEIEKRRKDAESTAKKLKEMIMAEMLQQGIKSFDNECIKITFIEQSTRESIDSTRLQKEMPDIAKQFIKTSSIKPSVRITLRG